MADGEKKELDGLVNTVITHSFLDPAVVASAPPVQAAPPAQNVIAKMPTRCECGAETAVFYREDDSIDYLRMTKDVLCVTCTKEEHPYTAAYSNPVWIAATCPKCKEVQHAVYSADNDGVDRRMFDGLLITHDASHNTSAEPMVVGSGLAPIPTLDHAEALVRHVEQLSEAVKTAVLVLRTKVGLPKSVRERSIRIVVKSMGLLESAIDEEVRLDREHKAQLSTEMQAPEDEDEQRYRGV